MTKLSVQNVYKHYWGHTALDGVSLEVKAGRIFGLLGPNGAGKTSLLRIINQITAPDSGQVLLDGEPLQRSMLERIGYLPEERGLYPKMKVGEQALYLAQLKGLTKAEAMKRLRHWFEKLEIMPWWDKKVNELSKGMQQKVQLVCAILHEPDLLILDEPFSGFDPVNAEMLKREILGLSASGTTIIFSTHNMQSVEEVCQDIALINRSRVVLAGSVEEVRSAHAERKYSLELSQTLTSDQLAGITHLSYTPLESGGCRLVISQDAGPSPRALLGALPQGIEPISLQPVVASMQEIFIKHVQSHEQA